MDAIFFGNHAAEVSSPASSPHHWYMQFSRRKQASIRLLIGVSYLLSAGCSPKIAPNPLHTDTGTSVSVSSADIFSSLADAVDEKNGCSITSQYQLAQVVLVLANEGVVSAADATQFDSQFPDAAKQAKDRPLTDGDAAKLRGIK